MTMPLTPLQLRHIKSLAADITYDATRRPVFSPPSLEHDAHVSFVEQKMRDAIEAAVQTVLDNYVGDCENE